MLERGSLPSRSKLKGLLFMTSFVSFVPLDLSVQKQLSDMSGQSDVLAELHERLTYSIHLLSEGTGQQLSGLSTFAAPALVELLQAQAAHGKALEQALEKVQAKQAELRDLGQLLTKPHFSPLGLARGALVEVKYMGLPDKPRWRADMTLDPSSLVSVVEEMRVMGISLEAKGDGTVLMFLVGQLTNRPPQADTAASGAKRAPKPKKSRLPVERIIPLTAAVAIRLVQAPDGVAQDESQSGLDSAAQGAMSDENSTGA